MKIKYLFLLFLIGSLNGLNFEIAQKLYGEQIIEVDWSQGNPFFFRLGELCLRCYKFNHLSQMITDYLEICVPL